MEQFKDILDRVRRFSYASVCFLASFFIVQKGNSFEAANFAMVVPIMCVLTALSLCILGLAVFVKSESNPA